LNALPALIPTVPPPHVLQAAVIPSLPEVVALAEVLAPVAEALMVEVPVVVAVAEVDNPLCTCIPMLF
jgi:hypothetical protein